jgi:DNA-binding protein HU-beta
VEVERLLNFLIFKKMNKADLANAVHEKLGGTKVQAEEVVETIINEVVGALKKGGEVSIAGLGIFSTKQRAARVARNPRTGASVNVAAMKVPKFRAAKALKDAVK